MQSTKLYFNNGTSDKEYSVQIKEEGDGYCVNYAYGRRNETQKTGTKTQAPVNLAQAQNIYDKLVKSKTSKGYVSQGGLASVSTIETDKNVSGFICQLLNPVDADGLDVLLDNDNFIMQKKHDGVRLTIEYKNGEIRGINRKGLYVSVSSIVADAYITLAEQLSCHSFIIDGEGLGDKHAAFDLLEIDGQSLKEESYQKRFIKLISIMPFTDKTPVIFMTDYAQGPSKYSLYSYAQEKNWEGVVFKNMDAEFESGRPNSHGNQLKYKFYKTASVIIDVINEKRSIGMKLLDAEGQAVFAGNVTIPANQDVPSIGDVAEVRYLYAMNPSNALFQPTFLGLRDDIDQSECLLNQLEYKAAAA